MIVVSLGVDISILTLVVLGVRLILSLVVLVLRLFDNVQLFHDTLSSGFVLGFQLLNQLLRLRSRVESSLFAVNSLGILALHGFWRIKTSRVLRNSQRRNITLLTGGGRIS